jgi:phospho-N-acetylmuramoyl-pentapeptide-transferase
VIYLLFEPLMDLGPANALRYISVRTAIALATALFIFLALYPAFLRLVRRKGAGQVVREDVPESHQAKSGTPTMGGVLLCAAILGSSLLWCRLDTPQVLYVLALVVTFCAVGLADDLGKIRDGRGGGLPGRLRLALEFTVAGGLLWVAVANGHLATDLWLPVFKSARVDLSWAYIPFGMIVIVGAANAVNLTDGLDGLAIGPVMISALTYGLLAWLTGNAVYSEFLSLPHVPGNGELAIIAVTVAGAGMGFLWFNSYPATVFMGDTGSLPLGAILGGLAVFTRNELLLVVVGGIFVAEALSVIVQVLSFKTTGKRVFAMAPLHHHFEHKGWQEPKIIVRFWIISILLALLALMTLKVR